MSHGKVLILGAGIGGLATSTAFAEAGYEVTVIEIQRSLHSSVYGVGIIQAPNQLRALDRIGVAQECIAQGFSADVYFRVYSEKGEFEKSLPGSAIPGYDFPMMNGITRPKLHKILTDRALEAGVNIEYGKTVGELKQFDDRIEVEITDGTTRVVDLLVGADGVHSVLRKHVLDEEHAPQYSGKSVFRINIPRLPEMDAIVRQEGWTADGERIGVGMVPLADDLGYLYANVNWDPTLRLTPEELRVVLKEKLASFGGPAGAVRDHYVDTDEEIVLRPEEWLLAPAPWHKGRIVLLGDAVHAVTPNTAQGAAQAIEDGVVLVETLTTNDSIEAALLEYTDRRFDRCRLVVEFGANARAWERDPVGDFDPLEAGRIMRESLVEPI